ncbi:hypothetical protein Bhyg_02683 [Pseudolycoriella hygida]|uniref:Putative zinc-finger domain-containing protein n=1 Tax=Pseudolycoriella hygida TaxID=35572 RepID=A0A9Q0NBW1_9DIPT|nr:hypothetical protein Bhyg_02683 [Pseudolycoriella hygida]
MKEGEIVDVNDDDIYETIISSDDEVDEDHLRRRIEELEAKNSELEKIASISKTYDYGYGAGNFIDLVADDDCDDDESYYMHPSKYELSSYSSSRRRSRSKRRKTSKREGKKSKRYKPYREERSKKTQPNRTRKCSDSESSSNEEYKLDPKKLQAALKRNTSFVHSTTLKRKLDGVSKTVEEFVKAKEDVDDEDISSSLDILQLLEDIKNEGIDQRNNDFITEEETETGLTEQDLRIIALKSAILKKAEARKKRKIIESQPYSPTDDIIMENVIVSKVNVNAKPKDELDNMEISPAVSPTNQDGSSQPIDMELESSEDENEKGEMQQQVIPMSPTADHVKNKCTAFKNLNMSVPVPDEQSLSNVNVPEQTNQISLSSDLSEQLKQQEEEEERALRESLLAGLKTSKRRLGNVKPQAMQEEIAAPTNNSISDATTETEHLRKQAISSMQKRRNLHKNLLPNPFAQKFTVQIPKPMEMSMPQITSNLKEALKRIKERQSVEADVASNDISAKIIANKVRRDEVPLSPIQIEAKKSTKKLPDCNETIEQNGVKASGETIVCDPIVNITCKQNGVKESSKTTPSEPIVHVARKQNGVKASHKTIPSHPVVTMACKQNGVKASTETVASNSIMEKSVPVNNKSNDVLKNVTCNNSAVETKTKEVKKIEIGILDEEDAAIRSLKAIAQRKVISEPNISLNQKENQLLRKASPKRTIEDKLAITRKAKINNVKVSRVITTAVEKPVKKMIIQVNNSDTESDDWELGQQSSDTAFNQRSYSGVASPASQSFLPSSPANVTDEKSVDNTSVNNDTFQRKLDEYLKSARTKVEQSKQETQPLKKASSLVSHLPPSSQLEYRRLINRMALLEREKMLKMSKAKVSKTKPSTNISVTISNDLCNPQPLVNNQTLQVDGNQNETEASAPKDNVEVPVQTENELSIPSEKMDQDSSIKDDNTNVPQQIVAQTKTTSKSCDSSEKSTNLLRNLSTLSEDDKKNCLRKIESEYMKHSELYLLDIKSMSLLVNKARQEKEKQLQMEFQVDELQAKIEELKKQLVIQKSTVSKLYPDISTSHKNIMKKRTKSLQLNKKCLLIGNEIMGADYKIPCDPKAEIAQKVKSLSSETKILRNMKKPNVFNKSMHAAESTGIEDKSSLKEIVNHTPVVAASDEVPQSSEISNISSKTSALVKHLCNDYLQTHDNIPAPYTIIKYSSPLDHMKNVGTTNPDSIVCPFQLSGSCADKECTYQHLS